MTDLYQLETYDFDLPQELIAQSPVEPRDHCRLMVVERQTEKIWEMPFYELTQFLDPQDRLILNDTKVLPARLHGTKETGAKIEILLLRALPEGSWKALAKPGRKLKPGAVLHFSDTFSCTVKEHLEEGTFILEFDTERPLLEEIHRHGQMPLPPYIARKSPWEPDKELYQTVFGKELGAVAAPTAGLHFTQAMLEQIPHTTITLHVGLETFRPVEVADIRQHKIHTEWTVITPEAAHTLNTHPQDKRLISVGTTCCRAIEFAADPSGAIRPGSYDASLFIYPGYQFKACRSLLTNFHFPKSTLLMLVSAFAGYDLIREAYARAIASRFRFYSYGDAMLIL